jgi:hypothetical protein
MVTQRTGSFREQRCGAAAPTALDHGVTSQPFGHPSAGAYRDRPTAKGSSEAAASPLVVLFRSADLR